MRCEELAVLLDAYLDAELNEQAMRQVDRHLLRCPACAHEARSLEQSRRLLQECIGPQEASPGFRERTAARLMDALADRLRPAPTVPAGRQWELPLDR